MKQTGVNKESEDDLFYSIYTRYMPILRALAKRYGTPYDDIEDIVQDTFMSYYKHYPLTWQEHKMKPMLCRIIKNRCVDALRRKNAHPVYCMDPETLQIAQNSLDPVKRRDALDAYLAKEEYLEVWEALKSMREDWAQVFILYIVQDRPMKEVSQILEITDAACRTRLTRGRKYLKQKLRRP